MKKLRQWLPASEPVSALEFRIFATVGIGLAASAVLSWGFARWSEARHVATLVGW